MPENSPIKCTECGEQWPCSVAVNPKAHRGDIVAMHTPTRRVCATEGCETTIPLDGPSRCSLCRGRAFDRVTWNRRVQTARTLQQWRALNNDVHDAFEVECEKFKAAIATARREGTVVWTDGVSRAWVDTGPSDDRLTIVDGVHPIGSRVACGNWRTLAPHAAYIELEILCTLTHEIVRVRAAVAALVRDVEGEP